MPNDKPVKGEKYVSIDKAPSSDPEANYATTSDVLAEVDRSITTSLIPYLVLPFPAFKHIRKEIATIVVELSDEYKGMTELWAVRPEPLPPRDPATVVQTYQKKTIYDLVKYDKQVLYAGWSIQFMQQVYGFSDDQL